MSDYIAEAVMLMASSLKNMNGFRIYNRFLGHFLMEPFSWENCICQVLLAQKTLLLLWDA